MGSRSSGPYNPFGASIDPSELDLTALAASLDDSFLLRASNLSDVADASTSRTNLGLTIGTDVQAYSATLAQISTDSGVDDSVLLKGAITGQTAETAPDMTADYLLMYDASVDALRKVLLSNFSKRAAGFFTRDLTTASGNQAITGLGFQPRLIVNISTGIQSTGAAYYSFEGFALVGTQYCSSVQAGGNSFGQTGFAAIVGTSGTAFQTFTLASLDADGFTVSWTKTSTPTGTATVGYLALG